MVVDLWRLGEERTAFEKVCFDGRKGASQKEGVRCFMWNEHMFFFTCFGCARRFGAVLTWKADWRLEIFEDQVRASSSRTANTQQRFKNPPGKTEARSSQS